MMNEPEVGGMRQEGGMRHEYFLVQSSQIVIEARLVLVHPHYSRLLQTDDRQHISPDNRVFHSIDSTETFRKQIHQLSQLLKPGLYLKLLFKVRLLSVQSSWSPGLHSKLFLYSR